MGSIWDGKVKLSVFGESHGAAIGAVIDGLPPGHDLDITKIKAEMARRAPGRLDISTPRREDDNFEILSGFFSGKTTGTPLCAVIRNENTRSGDYKPNLLRPGHADLAALLKYKGFADYRGGGHFSGRLTAPLVFAGAVAKQILKDIKIGARIYSIYNIKDAEIEPSKIPSASENAFPCYDPSAAEEMKKAILKAKEKGDSVGGVIECTALGLPGGLGDPLFYSLESRISAMMFSIPAVKAIEFGDGIAMAGMTGSTANDEMYIDKGKIRTITNHNGGINGGISNGEPVTFKVYIKPTPSIGIEQSSVDTNTNQNIKMKTHGRHDPCIVPRALPVIEAALAFCLLEYFI